MSIVITTVHVILMPRIFDTIPSLQHISTQHEFMENGGIIAESRRKAHEATGAHETTEKDAQEDWGTLGTGITNSLPKKMQRKAGRSCSFMCR